MDLHSGKTSSNRLVDILKQQMAPNPVSMKPTKTYDKFNISDIKHINYSDEEPNNEMEDASIDEDDNSAQSEEPAELTKSPGNFSSPFLALIKANEDLENIERRNSDVLNSSVSEKADQTPHFHRFMSSNSDGDMIGLLSRNERDVKVKRYLEKK